MPIGVVQCLLPGGQQTLLTSAPLVPFVELSTLVIAVAEEEEFRNF